jgi:hypothetical protein
LVLCPLKQIKKVQILEVAEEGSLYEELNQRISKNNPYSTEELCKMFGRLLKGMLELISRGIA